MGGMELLRRIKESSASTQVILITAYGSVENAVEAMKVGATDYLTKPFKIDELKLAVSRILNEKRLSEENSYLRHEIGQRYGLDNFIARSPAMRRVLEEVGSVAPTDATVLLRGESGTGKELIARAIHKLSRRHESIFVAVNCAALTETLLESELFGHEKGAFTGAISQKKGRVEIADGGTLFLDEVGDMSPAMQAKLLRALQEQAFERVGGTRTIKVDVRIIAATNRDLEGAIKEGKFREDLYYRLNVMSIRIPPLRERSECIIPLSEFFLDKFSRSLGRGVRKLSPEVVVLLLKHTWPGNVRELENAIERGTIVAKGDVVRAEDLPLSLQDKDTKPLQVDFPVVPLREMERRLIIKALDVAGGNRTRTAEILGISLRALQYKLKEYQQP
jgi:two-component system NtrC family response regulator/two-component system response regulator HydG